MSNKEELTTKGGFLALAEFNMNETMAEELEGLEGGFDRVKIPPCSSFPATRPTSRRP